MMRIEAIIESHFIHANARISVWEYLIIEIHSLDFSHFFLSLLRASTASNSDVRQLMRIKKLGLLFSMEKESLQELSVLMEDTGEIITLVLNNNERANKDKIYFISVY